MSDELIQKKDSYFDGGLAQWIGWKIAGLLVTLCTLGICYPWAVCMVYGWRINHTVVNGKRLRFTGKAISLFGLWIKWIFLTIFTLGIYSFWIPISLEKWRVKNTIFDNSTDFEIKDGILEKYIGTDNNVIIPDNVTKIGDYSFFENKKITSVVIPDTVTKIGDYAFFGCINLDSIELPRSIEDIGMYAFDETCKTNMK